MRGADRIVVNSQFTKKVVEGVWNGIGGIKGVAVVYPCVHIPDPEPEAHEENVNEPSVGAGGLWKGKKVLLSINRFERKKDIGLAIKAFADLKANERQDAILVLAGKYTLLSAAFKDAIDTIQVVTMCESKRTCHITMNLYPWQDH